VRKVSVPVSVSGRRPRLPNRYRARSRYRTRLSLSLPQPRLKIDNDNEHEDDFGPTGPLTLTLRATLALVSGTDN
jgi:hypothetical protein